MKLIHNQTRTVKFLFPNPPFTEVLREGFVLIPSKLDDIHIWCIWYNCQISMEGRRWLVTAFLGIMLRLGPRVVEWQGENHRKLQYLVFFFF